jgi:hypothetical protein
MTSEIKMQTSFEVTPSPWQLVFCYGAKVRVSGADGLDAWNRLKVLLKPTAQPIRWTEKCLTFFDQFLALGIVEDEDGSQTHEEWERDHFMLQHGRIPHRNLVADTVRLFQVAYNAGQASIEDVKERYPEFLMNFYIENDMLEPTTFVADAELLKFDDDLKDQIKQLTRQF